jgi:prolyl oligopeptidase
MEELDSEEVKEFVDAQAAVANTVLSTCEHSGRLRGQLTALFNHPRFRAPFKRRGSYFYFHNPGLQPHNTLFVQVRISYAHSFFFARLEEFLFYKIIIWYTGGEL